MTKEKVYLETSVISYLTARPSRVATKRAKQEWTRRWWEENRSAYDFYVSDTVFFECRKGDPEAAQRRLDAMEKLPVLTVTSAIVDFHEHLFAAKVLPEKARIDALHIAIAAVYGITYLATWNCTHMHNATLRKKILDEIERAGYTKIIMATPEELWRVTQ